VHERRRAHHPAAGCPQRLLEQPGEQVGRQVVDLEGLLVPVDGDRPPGERGAGVAGQHVDPREPVAQLSGQPADVVQPGEVGGQRDGTGQLRRDRRGLLRGSAHDHHPGAPAVQPAGRRGPDAVAGTGDDDDRTVVAQLVGSTRTIGIFRSVFCW
jgi:hypothetical protein